MLKRAAEVIRLSLVDQECFAQALLSPPRGPGGRKARRGLLHLGVGEPATGRSCGQHRQEATPLSNRACRSHGPLGRRSGMQGVGLGGALLADALDCAALSEIAAYALMMHAKDEAEAAFYQHHGFIALPDSPHTLFLPLATVQPSRNSPFSAS